MSYSVRVHFTSGTEQYVVLKDGFSLNEQVGKKGKHATQTCNITIKSSTAVIKFLQESAKFINAELYNGGTLLFRGVVRPYQGTSAEGNTEQPFSFEIIDFTEKMDNTSPATELVYSNQNLGTILTSIYSQAGLPQDVTLSYPAELENILAVYVKVPASSKSYAKIFEQLLWEYGYDYRFVGTTCQIVKTFLYDDHTDEGMTVAQVAAAKSIPTATDIKGTFKLSREDNWNDGVTVHYGLYRSVADVYLGRYAQDAPSDAEPWQYVLPYSHRQRTGNINTFYEWIFSWDGKPDNFSRDQVISVTNVNVYKQNDCSVQCNNITTNGCMLAGTYDCYCEYIHGKMYTGDYSAYFKGDITFTADTDATLPINGVKPEEITAEFITAESYALKLGLREQKRYLNAPFNYSWTSLSPYTPNAFVRITDSVTGIDVIVRIITCSKDSDGIYSVTAEQAFKLGTSVSEGTLRLRDIQDTGFSFDLTPNKIFLNWSESATVTATGSIFDIIEQEEVEDDLILVWSINNVQHREWDNVRAVTVPANVLNSGANTITATFYYNSTATFDTASCSIRKTVDTGSAVTVVEYCYGNAEQPLAGAVVGYQSSGNNIIVNADEQTLADYGWTKNTLTTPTDGRYIWCRVGSYTPPQTEADVTNWSIFRLAGDPKVFEVTASSSVFTRNERTPNEVNRITVIPTMSGYNANYTVQARINTKDGSIYDAFANNVLLVPYNVDINTEKIVIVMSGVDSDGNILESLYTISCSDITGQRVAFGSSETEITSTTYEDNGEVYDYIEGDSYVYIQSSGETQTSTVKVFNNGSWKSLNTLDRTYRFYDICLTDSLPAVFEKYAQGTNHVQANGYDWFKQIVAQYISAVYYFVGGAIYSGSYNQRGEYDSTTDRGGIYIGADGRIYANKIDIDGESYIHGDSIVGGKIQNTIGDSDNVVFETVKDISGTIDIETSHDANTKTFNWDDGIATLLLNYFVANGLTSNIVALANGARYNNNSPTFISYGKPNLPTDSGTIVNQRKDETTLYSATLNIPANYPPVTYRITGRRAWYYSANWVGGDSSVAYGGYGYTVNGTSVTIQTKNYSAGAIDFSVVLKGGDSFTFWANSVRNSWYHDDWGNGSYSIDVASDTIPSGNNVNLYTGNANNTRYIGTLASLVGSSYCYNTAVGVYNLTPQSGWSGGEVSLTANRWVVNATQYFRISVTKYKANNVDIGDGIKTFSSFNTSSTFTLSGTSYRYDEVAWVQVNKSGSTYAITVQLNNGTQFKWSSQLYGSAGTLAIDLTTFSKLMGAYTYNLMPIFDANGARPEGSGSVGTAQSKFKEVYADYVSGNSSSRAKKRDISDYTGNALEVIKNTKVVSFKYKKEIEDSDLVRYGFIAEDTPAELSTVKHDIMDTGSCIGILIKAVQELSKQIEELKKEK